MRYKQISSSLVEGVQYGEKEKQYIISNLDKFNFGIEIELMMNISKINVLQSTRIANEDFIKLIRHGVTTRNLEYENLRSTSRLVKYIEEPFDQEASLKALDKVFKMWTEDQIDDYTSIDDLYYFIVSYASEEAAIELRDQVKDHLDSFIKFLDMFDIKYEIKKIDYENLSSHDEVRSFLDKEGYGDSFSVEWEHGNMAEVISKLSSGEDIMRIMKESKEIIEILQSKGMTAEAFSGMHMSISYKTDKRDMDFLKFLMLSDTYRQLIPSEHRRDMVNDIREQLVHGTIEYLAYKYNPKTNFDLKKFLNEMLYNISFEKYNSVNFGNFDIQNGRVELRWPGGENYTDRIDSYFNSAFRAMYALEAAYNPDAFKKEFHQTVIREINSQLQRMYKLDFVELIGTLKKADAYFDRQGVYAEIVDIDINDGREIYIQYEIDGKKKEFQIRHMIKEIKREY